MLATVACLLLGCGATAAADFAGLWLVRLRPSDGGRCDGRLQVQQTADGLLAIGNFCGVPVAVSGGEVRSNEAVFRYGADSIRLVLSEDGERISGVSGDSTIQGFRDEWPLGGGTPGQRRQATAGGFVARDTEQDIAERRKAWEEGRFADAARGLLTPAEAEPQPPPAEPTLAEQESER